MLLYSPNLVSPSASLSLFCTYPSILLVSKLSHNTLVASSFGVLLYLLLCPLPYLPSYTFSCSCAIILFPFFKLNLLSLDYFLYPLLIYALLMSYPAPTPLLQSLHSSYCSTHFSSTASDSSTRPRLYLIVSLYCCCFSPFRLQTFIFFLITTLLYFISAI